MPRPSLEQDRYVSNLEALANRVPQALYEFVSRSFSRSNDPKGCWLKSVEIVERNDSSSERVVSIEIRVRLFSPRLNSLLDLIYKDVVGYAIQSPPRVANELESSPNKGHAVFHADRLTMAGENTYCHELYWRKQDTLSGEQSSSWRIEARGFEYVWLSTDSKPGAQTKSPLVCAAQVRIADDEARSMILSELKGLGYPVTAVEDLPRAGLSYESAVPVLAGWLPRLTAGKLKESIVMALAVPWGQKALPQLFEEFRATPNEHLEVKWRIAQAISALAVPEAAEQLMELAADRNHGYARTWLVDAIGKLKVIRLKDRVAALLSDEEVTGQAIRALGMMGASDYRTAIERFTDHPVAWIRKEAQQCLSLLAGSSSS